LLSALTGDKRLSLIPVSQLEKLTGYVRGGVTALACKHPYPVYIDRSVEDFSQISVSGGMRGVQILLAPKDYVRAVSARVGNICRASGCDEC
jgi:Cys-tRNA(Pro)/Cys-tRNA(Cys) deacylase